MIWWDVETTINPIRDHCGIVGIYSKEQINIPEHLFYALFSLQHRGQESAGIAYRKNGSLVAYKGLGMVSTVLSRYLEEPKLSDVGIGHVRYSTKGGNRIENAQPILADCNKGELAIAHNGTLSNGDTLKRGLFDEGSIFQTTSDTELILHMIARSRRDSFIDALKTTLAELRGAFSLVMVHNGSLIGIRDPQGFRPLLFGEKDGVSVFASESCALDILGFSSYRPVEPGEMIIVDRAGARSERYLPCARKSHCIFELIYFARPDSRVFNESVHMARKRMGEALAAEETHAGDIVVPVPDSGNSAALGFSERSGVPLEFGLTRNHYAGRSFIMPTTAKRELVVRMKLHPVRDAIKGKRIFLIDDSLVRGTTSGIIVSMLKAAGAKEVHIRLSSPEIRYPCHFGIDIPTREELISNRMSPDEIAAYVGADSVKFLPLASLASCVGEPGSYCYGCFNGEYPAEIPGAGTA